uniref:Uncharacterized protein n=1 Tax=Tanacetum cinerariifolium TaxID=118510 RepID=A0A6L2KI05_TANCI|nr:hypothetical protein [Tanacetum cinerariifolium]
MELILEQTQQGISHEVSKALDDALVAPANRLKFWKSNMRLKTDIKPKEATCQVVLDSLALTSFYHAFLITADVPAIYIFTKIIIDYFMSKDLSISRRNKMFCHTARDDTLFTSMRCISRHEDTLCTDEGTGTKAGVPGIPPYESKSDKESWKDSEDKDDNDDDDDGDNNDDDESDDHKEHEEEEYDDEFHEEEEDIDDEETMYDEEDNEVTKELYDDVNVNLGNEDIDMTIADQGASDQQNVSQESGFRQEEEDDHVTIKPVIDTQKTRDPIQSSFVSSDFTRKLLNLDNPSPDDNEIATMMDTTAQHATVIPKITSSITTTIPPPPPFLHPLQQEATPTPTPTAFTTTTSKNPAVTLPEFPNFVSVFKFNERVFALESEMSELKQTNEFAKAVDSTMKTIIKDQVKAQVSKIMPKIENYVTESLGAEVLVRSTNQPQMAYTVSASLSEFELKKILIDKMEANKSIKRSDHQKNLYNALVESYKKKKSSSTSKGASQSQHKSSSSYAHVEEPSHTIEDSGMQKDQEFITGDNDEQPANKKVTKAVWFRKPK